MDFKDKQQIKISPVNTMIYLIIAVALSQVVMHLDQARGAAYIIAPLALCTMWARDSNITWEASHKWFTYYSLFFCTYGVGGFYFLSTVISIEKGDTINSDGIIYTLANLVAN